MMGGLSNIGSVYIEHLLGNATEEGKTLDGTMVTIEEVATKRAEIVAKTRPHLEALGIDIPDDI